MYRSLSLILVLQFFLPLKAQNDRSVPYDHVISNKELIDLLNTEREELALISADFRAGYEEKALISLAAYFKELFSERYFFDWKDFENRFSYYNRTYKREAHHFATAYQHLDLYPARVCWKLPFKNLENREVTAYEYRHLTRQHKAGDIALLYHYTGENRYLNYIPEQAESLNEAFDRGEYEKIEDGNGAYEAFRGANRVYNWLFAHQVLLASDNYTWQQQITMIKTFLHTGANLYFHNAEYAEGNHQTRGMSALAMLAVIFEDVRGTDRWLERSKSLLEEHMDKEIFEDNFQFERSVHYHISDIRNYTFPYQIAGINNIDFGPGWDEKIEGLFDALVKLALPDRHAPVLQDDTDSPWAEWNDIGEIMAYGTALFGKPEYRFFASSRVSPDDYWLLSANQLKRFEETESAEPVVLSTEFPGAGYYIMRSGWEKDDPYMIISAGLSREKPDHQHGDMLGIQAYANGNMVLPNYQVRYFLPDLDFFKNSWVKNVALVDSIPQGLEWTGNKGGSGFGKYKSLPEPELTAWTKTRDIDLFIGKHNAYSNIHVDYHRVVIFVKDGFWIVEDVFQSENEARSFQQVWQGHYTEESEGRHYRSVFPDGSGLEIVQLGNPGTRYHKGAYRGKGNLLIVSEKSKEFVFTTLLLPFKSFESRFPETGNIQNFTTAGWSVSTNYPANGNDDYECDAKTELKSGNRMLLLGMSFFEKEGLSVETTGSKGNLYIDISEHAWELINCGKEELLVSAKRETSRLQPGEILRLTAGKGKL